MISELAKDVLIKYLYIKSYTHPHPMAAEAFCGHPITGRVYRSVYNKNTKHHRVLLPDNVVLAMDTLTGENHELIDINIDNILDYNIAEEDLDIFLQSNDDLFYQPIQNTLHQAISNIDMDESDFSERASQSVLGLWSLNPTKAEILVTLSDILTDSELRSHEEISGWMRFHPQRGLPLNIDKAIKALDVYWGDDKRKNEDPQDLYQALEAICIELERIYNQE